MDSFARLSFARLSNVLSDEGDVVDKQSELIVSDGVLVADRITDSVSSAFGFSSYTGEMLGWLTSEAILVDSSLGWLRYVSILGLPVSPIILVTGVSIDVVGC